MASPPLTRDDLVAIEERNLARADVRTLLWEVDRFRALALYVDQLQRIVGTLPGQQGDVLEAIRRQLEDEPCVKEFPRLPHGARAGSRRKTAPPDVLKTEQIFLLPGCEQNCSHLDRH